MQDKKILLGSAKHKLSKNEDNFINLELFSPNRELGQTEESYVIDEYKQYFNEKDNSNKYRLAFTITPYCTNVLFNVITEPVYKEGSDDCILITKESVDVSNTDMSDYQRYKSNLNLLSLSGAVADTGYSHPEAGGLKYHPGYDIFNNHYFRKLGYVVVNKQAPGGNEKFNTIEDFFRRDNGYPVQYVPLISINGNTGINVDKKNASLYKKATLLRYYNEETDSFEAIDENLSEENGWFGFVNKSIIPTKNYGEYTINKCMNDYEAGDFVDMYPDRTLFSFVPKYNYYRKRAEKNWNYCITYPYASNKNNKLVSDVLNNCGGRTPTYENGLFGKIETILNRETGINNIPQNILFKIAVKHNLNEGDYVTISFVHDNGEVSTATNIRVVSVGNDGEDKEHYFSVRSNNILNFLVDSEDNISEIRIRKCENGVECEYYVRWFKKIPISDDAEISSQINKLAFSQNAYSDPVSQIVFTEDINIEGLVDNLNRPLSELYLTIVKNNKGYEKWYKDGNRSDSDIEYSHCFGKITSGFDLPSDFDDYNVHKIHNIFTGLRCYDMHTINMIPLPPYAINEENHAEEIKFENDSFCGDIVEFSPSTFTETVLAPVYHRFNTAQREFISDEFKDYKFTEISRDVYDSGNTSEFEQLSIEFKQLSILSVLNDRTSSQNITNVNLLPEGYYYKPHYKIKIREFSQEVNEGFHTDLVYTAITGNIIETDRNYYFQAKDDTFDFEGTKVYVYKKINGKYYELKYIGFCVGLTGNSIELSFYDTENNSAVLSVEDISENCKIFKHNTEMPEYAYNLKDGTGRYIWRELLSFSEVPSDSELYDSQFTNGAHYHHKNISFYLKRQDPTGEYGLGNKPIALQPFIIDDVQKDVSYSEYKKVTDEVRC